VRWQRVQVAFPLGIVSLCLGGEGEREGHFAEFHGRWVNL
jgi:hypothetical protein